MKGLDGSNPPLSTIQSTSFRTSRRIDRNSRARARFAMKHGPGERPRRVLNGGMRQNLSARYFARSMEVRPNIALVEGHVDRVPVARLGRRDHFFNYHLVAERALRPRAEAQRVDIMLSGI